MKANLRILIFSVIFALGLSEVWAKKPLNYSSISANRSISGKALKSNGKPLAYTEIELVSLGSDKYADRKRILAITTAAGNFSFNNVPSGSYTLSINFEEKPTDLSPYPTYFYPNTRNRSEAKIFEVTETSVFSKLVFRLMPPLIPRKITGKVFFADRKPAANVLIFLKDNEFDRYWSSSQTITDANGDFTVNGYESRKYQIRAVILNVSDRFSGESSALAQTDVFTLDAKTPVITITLRESEEFRKYRKRMQLLDEKTIGRVIVKGNSF